MNFATKLVSPKTVEHYRFPVLWSALASGFNSLPPVAVSLMAMPTRRKRSIPRLESRLLIPELRANLDAKLSPLALGLAGFFYVSIQYDDDPPGASQAFRRRRNLLTLCGCFGGGAYPLRQLSSLCDSGLTLWHYYWTYE